MSRTLRGDRRRRQERFGGPQSGQGRQLCQQLPAAPAALSASLPHCHALLPARATLGSGSCSAPTRIIPQQQPGRRRPDNGRIPCHTSGCRPIQRLWGSLTSKGGTLKALVIGAGLGGLGTGIQLARRGWEVTILEQNRAAGGRMNRINESGFHFDTGPTLLMMPEVLERIFQECGRNPERELPIQRLLPGYEVRFADGAHFRVGNQESTLQEVARLAPADLAGFRALLKDMEAKY
ncbi:MAG: FAD-dependent oxidoreductase, partial [Armatimonadetes bacterium]|nr:FAD-dependent oxidoreductase [Armatimonadota bacterium]